MITLEITATERIYLPKENKVGEWVTLYRGSETYEKRVKEDGSGTKYVDFPVIQKVLVPSETNAESIAVYQEDKLLFRGGQK